MSTNKPLESPKSTRGAQYEDLEGGTGRGVFYRPQRFKQNELSPIQITVRASLPGSELELNLWDLSQNGIAVFCPAEPELPSGTLIDKLTVRLDGHEAYSGQALVRSTRQEAGRSVLGLSLIDAPIDIADVLRVRDIRSWPRQSSRLLSPTTRTWHSKGNHQFKALIAELRLFFEDASRDLAELESVLPLHVLHGDRESGAPLALINHVQEQFTPAFLDYSNRIDAALRECRQEDKESLKDFSLRMVHDYLMKAPFFHRTRHKPLGYPGDYQVMQYIYEQQFEGATLFGKALHHAAIQTSGARAVRERKEVVKGRIRSLLASHDESCRPLRIASIAAGPAQEIFEILRDDEPPGGAIEIVLFEQDPQALAFAQGRIAAHAERWGSSLRMTYLHDSIKRLLTDQTTLAEFGPFDMLFCAGLFDYLRPASASRLIRHFYSTLAPGGSAHVGNMTPINPCIWFLEQHLEWYLLYRTEEQLLALGRRGAPDAELSILSEPTRVNPFLLIERAG